MFICERETDRAARALEDAQREFDLSRKWVDVSVLNRRGEWTTCDSVMILSWFLPAKYLLLGVASDVLTCAEPAGGDS